MLHRPTGNRVERDVGPVLGLGTHFTEFQGVLRGIGDHRIGVRNVEPPRLMQAPEKIGHWVLAVDFRVILFGKQPPQGVPGGGSIFLVALATVGDRLAFLGGEMGDPIPETASQRRARESPVIATVGRLNPLGLRLGQQPLAVPNENILPRRHGERELHAECIQFRRHLRQPGRSPRSLPLADGAVFVQIGGVVLQG